jgi:Arc/MetJ family transcription regulator
MNDVINIRSDHRKHLKLAETRDGIRLKVRNKERKKQNTNMRALAASQQQKPVSTMKGLICQLSKSARYQVELDDELIQFIDRVKGAVGVRTRKEFVEDAVTLLAWAIAEKQAGRMLASADPSGGRYKEYILPYRSLLAYEPTNTGKKPGSIDEEGRRDPTAENGFETAGQPDRTEPPGIAET